MKSESVAGSPRRADVRTGGWSAGVFSETPRAIRPLRGANGYDSTNTTPAKPTNTFGTPGAAFSLGMDTPLAGPSSANRHRITYLGPGMSPRRMIPKPQSGRKPLFSLNLSEDESAPKKRRVEEGGLEIDGDANHQRSRVNGLSSSVSMPNFATFDQRKSTAMDSEKDNTSKTPGRPSPLSYQNGVNGRQDADAIGKKRAADIMKELIDEEMGPEEAARQPEYIMINPYDTDSAASSSVPTPSTPRSPMRSAIPQKSILRSSLRGKETPKRGAAAKLEGHKSRRKLTTLEILQGKRPVSLEASQTYRKLTVDQWTETSTPNHKQNETPSKSPQSETWTREDDEMEIDAYFDKTPSRTPAPPSRPAGRSPSTSPVPAPAPSSSKIPSPEPFAPFVVPTLTSSNLPIPSFQPTTSSQSFPSPSQDSALAPAQKKVQPKFNPSPLSSSITPIDIDEPELPRRAPASTTKTPTDANAIYLSAKDSALKIAKPALPFFTFTLTAPTSSPSDPVRSKALERPTEIFKFTLPAVDATPTTSKFVFGAPKPQEEAEWTCSMCMLKNPGSAKEKCLICEEKRP